MVWLKKSGSGWKLHFYSGGRIQYPLEYRWEAGISNYVPYFKLWTETAPYPIWSVSVLPARSFPCRSVLTYKYKIMFTQGAVISAVAFLPRLRNILTPLTLSFFADLNSWTERRFSGWYCNVKERRLQNAKHKGLSLSLSLTSDKLPNGDHVTCLSPIPPYSSSSIRATAVELTMQVIVIAMCTREKVVHPNPKISKRIIWNLRDRGWKRAELRQFWWNWKEITSSLGGYRFWIYIFERLFL